MSEFVFPDQGRVTNSIGGVSYNIPSTPGLTKRELFAAMAMQGLIMRDSIIDTDRCAAKSTAFADALLAELTKTEELGE